MTSEGQTSTYTRTPPAPSKQCHLLELPAELRNRIYELVVADHTSIHQPNLMRTCRQTRGEALSLFYSTHIFHFSFEFDDVLPASLVGWTNSIGKERADLVNKVFFDIWVRNALWTRCLFTLRCTRITDATGIPGQAWRAPTGGLDAPMGWTCYKFASWKDLDKVFQYDSPVEDFRGHW
ncbi:hypothetical protein CLAFUW4_06607 [Fulvia fulva]|uniref:F-box domain-containing protein n=1 Tax=Passalora fulva TaxID=5499 RepID=A0A9Q8PBK4_PASFU|nr:uncharacterized protein CLAFUR5_06752 [Fulvia fulva]KAK4622091.1 hypothetical protein CLAFUR4_06615 [Fulvia fulva]KAK4623393.1 hypothetical protein CLAFUR0_06609 [Fulvia fulva]UJO19461.1 hypothetical protein CLAFUR5_06752 [Fulvia fulva]WPV16661.1 hypothetical protein CLAFUW4_06607 [Fulvia fulva]WPV31010.1 hypothetical protein CLAFUW7_06606 [Fulvia fulva]